MDGRASSLGVREMTEVGVLLAIPLVLSGLTYNIGVSFLTLPLPRRWRAYGPLLMSDAMVSLFAVSSISAIQLLMVWLSGLVDESFGGPFSSSVAAFAVIESQLTLIDTSLVLIVAAVSSTVVLAPVAEILARMMGPAVTSVTTAIILWAIIQIALSLFPRVWLLGYAVGLAFFSLPFRLGRSVGAYLMSTSIVVSIALPLLPSLALYLEGMIGWETSFRNLTSLGSQLQTNPLAIPSLIASLPSMLAGLIAALIVALIVFPVAYLFMMSLLIRRVTVLIGGSSVGFDVTSLALGTSKQLSRDVAG